MHQLEAVLRLTDEFAPVAVAIVYLCRRCIWDGRAHGSGEDARKASMCCLLYLLSLCEADAQQYECVQTLALALLMCTSGPQ